MQRRIPIEQLTSFLSNPDPRTKMPEEKMNNQESINIKRTHIRGQERALSVELPRSAVRLEMRCARMVTPRRWIVALRTLAPTLGNTIVLDRSMSFWETGTEGRSWGGVISKACVYKSTTAVDTRNTRPCVLPPSRAKIHTP
jgi:hypothetical protein